MKTLRLFSLILIAVVLSGCSKYLFVVTSNESEEINVYLNSHKKGTLNKGDTIEFYGSKISNIDARNTSNTFEGTIKYVPIKKHEYSLTISQKKNIYEISKDKVSGESNKEFEVYNLLVGKHDEIKTIQFEGFGYLNLTSNEQDVEVFIDNEKIGTITDVPFNKKIPAGYHILMVRKNFFKPISVKITVNDKEILPYNFELVKASGWIEDAPDEAKTNQARGNLTIATEMSDYVVVIEGIEKPAPFHLKNMPAGVYRLGIRCKDFEKDLEVTIDLDRTTFIDLDDLYKR